MTGEIVELGHLGGYRAGGDEATWYPELWTWLVHDHGVKSVIDVGCGDGVALRYFRDRLGCRVLGIDGVPQDDPNGDIVEHDYTTGPFDWMGPRERDPDFAVCDLVWSCEFVEHVEERYLPNFLDSFQAGPLVLMTHADPGQAGYHHVNCRTEPYWAGVMAGAGYWLDHALTGQARQVAAANRSPWNHFVRSGLAFRRFPS